MSTKFQDALAFVQLFDRHAQADDLHPCKHGHISCSTERGGRCLDETLTEFPELDDSAEHPLSDCNTIDGQAV